MRPELRRALSHPTWLGREVARLSRTSRGVDVRRARTYGRRLPRDPAPRRSITGVCEPCFERVQARSVRVALCGDRGAGGASSRSQRAPAHSRARERCRFKRVEPRGSSCSLALVAPARQHDGKVRAVKKLNICPRCGADFS